VDARAAMEKKYQLKLARQKEVQKRQLLSMHATSDALARSIVCLGCLGCFCGGDCFTAKKKKQSSRLVCEG
jgi:hypothetical protein